MSIGSERHRRARRRKTRGTPASQRTRSAATTPAVTTRPIAIANQHPRLKLDRRAVESVIHLLDAHHTAVAGPRSRQFPGELSLVFLTDQALANVHGAFLDDPTTTDVITFEGDPGHGIGGEICVSADTAEEYAKEHGVAFAEELTLYLVHGWLHLAGHDDLKPHLKRVMRRAEARAMTLLRKFNAIPKMVLV